MTFEQMTRRVHAFGVADASVARIRWAKALSVVGVVAYNWWVVVPFVPGMMPSVNGFFSDLEASGQPHAGLLADADTLAGVLMVTALLLRGSHARQGVRSEWKWMVAFGVAGMVGGRYPYYCSEGLSATCRHLEWRLKLPAHHYVHVATGIAEFALLTGAAVIAMRRTDHDGSVEARTFRGVVGLLVLAYPLLGVAYLTDRLGTFVEPIFFVAFTLTLLMEVYEPIDRGRPSSASSGSALGLIPPAPVSAS